MNNIGAFKLNQAAKKAIQISQQVARDEVHLLYGAPHMLLALMNPQVGLASFMKVSGVKTSAVKEWAGFYLKSYKYKGKAEDPISADEAIVKLFNAANGIKHTLNTKDITPLTLLLGLLRAGIVFSSKEINSLVGFGLNEEKLIENHLNDSLIIESLKKGSAKAHGNTGGTGSTDLVDAKTFRQYCQDNVLLAQRGEINPIFGRKEENQRIVEALGRRQKPNLIVIGEPGVGKTVLVENLAFKIAKNTVPRFLSNAKLFSLDIGALVAGASYRGEVEDRMKKILNELKRLPNAILFIDEIHMLFMKESGANGVVNLLKPELAKGEFKLIGTSTLKEYRQHIEKNSAFIRRFDVLTLEAPTQEQAIEMLKFQAPVFEKHHNLKLEEGFIPKTVKFAVRHFPERQLPDSALDLLDRTLTATKINLDRLKVKLEKIESKGEKPEFVEEFFSLLDGIHLPELQASEEDLDKAIGQVKNIIKQYEEKVPLHTLSHQVSKLTGIQVGNLDEDQKGKVINLVEALKSAVVGQDHALDQISAAFQRYNAGLTEAHKPIASFFILGPTGTGKTELAKTIAEKYFGSRTALLQFDMSEYMERQYVSKLQGAAPGLVGYEEGGVLINKIRNKPHSVVLFDEIEKAHPDIFKIFLQLLEEGHLFDSQGKKGHFKDSLIIFTSNIESEWLVNQYNSNGELPSEEDIKDKIMGSKTLKPEFINRLNAVIPFAPLSKENLVKILDIQLKGFRKLLEPQGIKLEVTQEAKFHLSGLGYSPEFGARPLKRVIETHLANPISEWIILGKASRGKTILVSMSADDKDLQFEVT